MPQEIPGYRKVGDGQYVLVDPGGADWREVTGWLEPREVRQLTEQGALLVLHLCEGWFWGAQLDDEVVSHVVTAVQSHKLAQGKYSGRVIYEPSLWVDQKGRELVLLAETVAKKKKIIREIRGNYKLDSFSPEGWF